MEVVLVPEAALGFGRRRQAGLRDVLDVVSAARDETRNAVRPQRSHDARRAAAPVVSADDRAIEGERVDQREEVGAKGRLLAGARRIRREERRRAVAAHVRHDHARTGGRQARRDLVVAARVVWKAVDEHDRPAVGRAVLLVRDIEHACDDVRHGFHRRCGHAVS